MYAVACFPLVGSVATFAAGGGLHCLQRLSRWRTQAAGGDSPPAASVPWL